MLDLVVQALDAHPDWIDLPEARRWMASAARSGELEVMEELLRRGLTLDDTYGGLGLCPLSRAAGDPAVVDWLLEHGADPTAPGVMAGAAAYGSVETIAKLVALGGDLRTRTGKPPSTPFQIAQRLGRGEEVLSLLRVEDFDARAWLEARLDPLSTQPTPAGAPFALVQSADGTVCTLGLCTHPLAGMDGRVEVLIRPSQDQAAAAWPREWLLSVGHRALEAPVLQPLNTIGNGEPPRPLGDGIPFVGSLTVDEEHDGALADGTPVRLLSLFPLHPGELALARQDPLRLIARFQEAGLPDEPVADPARPPLA